jgi:hypothetical protein
MFSNTNINRSIFSDEKVKCVAIKFHYMLENPKDLYTTVIFNKHSKNYTYEKWTISRKPNGNYPAVGSSETIREILILLNY